MLFRSQQQRSPLPTAQPLTATQSVPMQQQPPPPPQQQQQQQSPLPTAQPLMAMQSVPMRRQQQQAAPPSTSMLRPQQPSPPPSGPAAKQQKQHKAPGVRRPRKAAAEQGQMGSPGSSGQQVMSSSSLQPASLGSTDVSPPTSFTTPQMTEMARVLSNLPQTTDSATRLAALHRVNALRGVLANSAADLRLQHFQAG